MNVYAASHKVFASYHLIADNGVRLKLISYGTTTNCKDWLSRLKSSGHLLKCPGRVDVLFEYWDQEPLINIIRNNKLIAPDNKYRIKLIVKDKIEVMLCGIEVWTIELPTSDELYVRQQLCDILDKEVDNELEAIYNILQAIK